MIVSTPCKPRLLPDALGLGGIWHVFFPEHRRFQFWTSSGIIHAYKGLEVSHRHDDEIEAIFSKKRRAYVEKNRGK